ncbi:MAG: hypothetical protein AAB305_05530 [Candidatus Zixiibacteriota bacterium]|mgnify:CR=1 FL=1
MTVSKLLILAVAGLLISASATRAADSDGRVYGKITTVDGDVLEGLIRWDKNEGAWVDILNGNKERSRQVAKRARDSRREKIRGLKRGFDFDPMIFSFNTQAESGIRMGHIRSIEVDDDDRAILTLKSGETVEFEGGSTDIGSDVREIIIEDKNQGELELVWDDIERVDFMACPETIASGFGERLYGVLTTRRGETFVGWICWDVDEIFANDILDGEENGRSRKLKFGRITSIERYSSSGARIVLANGDEMILRGSNDIDNSNSGILVLDPGIGQVRVEWDEFEKVEFKPQGKPVGYAQFDGGTPIWGTVTTEDGDLYTGSIKWDMDEAFTWEILDGESRDITYDVEFGLIKSIEKVSDRYSLVTLLDGRELKLGSSNDVDESNKGIVVTDAKGEETVIEWELFSKLDLPKK